LNTLDSVSVVVRTLGQSLFLLKRALSSLTDTGHRPLEIVVVYQGLDVGTVSAIRELFVPLPDVNYLLIQNPGVGDRRSENLNLGWASASSPFIGILDDDDEVLQNHFALHLDALKSSGRVWSYSQTILSRQERSGKIIGESCPFLVPEFKFARLLESNFIPIHSFVINRNLLAEKLAQSPFCEQMTRSEDWDFLIRLACLHEPVRLEAFTCKYAVFNDGTNTNISLQAQGAPEIQSPAALIWAKNEELLKKRVSKFLCSERWWIPDTFEDHATECRVLKSRQVTEVTGASCFDLAVRLGEGRNSERQTVGLHFGSCACLRNDGILSWLHSLSSRILIPELRAHRAYGLLDVSIGNGKQTSLV